MKRTSKNSASKRANKKTPAVTPPAEITPPTKNILQEDFDRLLNSIQEDFTKDIQDYLTRNNISYSANTKEFTLGLLLGLSYGVKHAYKLLTDEPGAVIVISDERIKSSI